MEQCDGGMEKLNELLCEVVEWGGNPILLRRWDCEVRERDNEKVSAVG